MNAANKLTPMTLDHVAPELREPIRKMPSVPVSSVLGRWFLRSAMKVFVREQQYDGVKIEKRTGANGVNVRIYTPSGDVTGAGLLWIHGGGMVIGGAIQDDAFCADTARKLGIIVVSAEYRLAPEFPFPAALDDCHAAWMWLQKSAAELHVDPKRVAIGGQSAGGGLAASLVQRIHDEGGTQPIAQWLFCPMLDDRTAAQHDLDAIGHKVWDNRQNRTGWKSFLAAEPGADRVPDYAVAARRKELGGLPTTWIGTGDIELFFDEDKSYADRLKAAGVACVFDVVTGAPHGFERIAAHTKLAQDYMSRGQVWLGEKLAAG